MMYDTMRRMPHVTGSIKFVKPDNPILTKQAEKIPKDSLLAREVKAYIEEMFEVAYGEQREKNKPLLVGLAAPQIGISKQIILVDVIANGKGIVGDLRVYINPKIIWTSDEVYEWYEGCFSTDRVCGVVSRPYTIKIQAYNQQGEEVEELYSGYTARIFQHEIDHLQGKEFVSHITDDSKLHWVEDEEFPSYRNLEGWKKWKTLCSRKRWHTNKGCNIT